MNQPVTIALIELREQYQGLVSHHEQKASLAKAQLLHVEALLLENLFPAQELSTQASLEDEIPGLKEANVSPEIVYELSQSREPQLPEQTPKTTTAKRGRKATTISKISTPTASKQSVRNSQAKVESLISGSNSSQKGLGRKVVLSLPKEYQGLTKNDAVAKILQENAGKPVHIDDIIERLYGKLSVQDFKAEKTRMRTLLITGVKRNFWQKADVPQSFIIAGSSKTTSAVTKASAKTTARKTQTSSVKKSPTSRKPQNRGRRRTAA
jgi:hypothetical protein